MNQVEFKLTMPGRGSWNGGWSGEGRDYLIFKKLTDKKVAELKIDKTKGNSWGHFWGDGWSANVRARILEVGEKKRRSAGFAGYDWMVDNILCYGQTEKLTTTQEG